jgi:hypothetical protein
MRIAVWGMSPSSFKESSIQQRQQSDPLQPDRTRHDPLTPELPNAVKPVQSIVWVMLAIGIAGLIAAIIFIFVTR